MAILAAGLEQEDRDVLVLGQARSKHRAGGTGTDDDVVEIHGYGFAVKKVNQAAAKSTVERPPSQVLSICCIEHLKNHRALDL